MQLDDIDIRFGYHAPSTPEVIRGHEFTRGLLGNVAFALNDLLPEGREKSLVVTHLEEAMFWANAAIARNQSVNLSLDEIQDLTESFGDRMV